MVELTFTEKALLKEYFETQRGIFLGMNDEEFSQFFKDLGVTIEESRYETAGTSQIDRFLILLEIEARTLVIKVLKESYLHEELFIKKGFENLLKNKRVKKIIHRLSEEETEDKKDLDVIHSKETKPFIGGNQRRMSELSHEELTKIVVKAYGALVWKNASNEKKTKIVDIERSKDFKNLLDILKNQHGLDLSKKSSKEDVNRNLVHDSLSAINPFPQKKKKK